MKVATFGCSFAHIYSNCGAPNFNMHGRPWMSILNTDFKHNVANFGKSGTGVYFSYSEFKKHYKKFDKIVFLGTFSDRKHSPNFKGIVDFSIHHVDATPPWINKDQYNLIKNYYTYIHNDQEAEDMKELMVEDIKRLGGDNLLYLDVPTTLANVSIMEQLVYRHSDLYDHRWCHMSNENNLIFATKINDWINGKPFVFNIEDFKKPTVEELKSYYEPT